MKEAFENPFGFSPFLLQSIWLQFLCNPMSKEVIFVIIGSEYAEKWREKHDIT